MVKDRFMRLYKEYEEIKKTIDKKCLLCRKEFDWHEPVIGKLPENLWFCMKCIEKFKDEKEYSGIDAWFTVEYEPGIEFEYKN